MNGEAQGPDVPTLIGKARGELLTMPKITRDEHVGIDPSPGEEPSDTKALREKVAQRMTKTPSGPTKVEDVERPKLTSLDSIRWVLIPTGDARTEESPKPRDRAMEPTDEQRKAELLVRAEHYKEDKSGQYYLGHQVLGRFNGYGRLQQSVNGVMPEELQATLVLSGDYGYGRESDTYAEQVYYAAMSVLRKDSNGDGSSWRGIDGYIPDGAAMSVLKAAETAKRGVPLTEDDLTRCMITALACGGPIEAIQMATLAKQFVKPPRGEKNPDQYEPGLTALGKLLTRYSEKHSFDRAYVLSPESTKRRTDAQFATLDQNPKYSDLLQYPGVPLLIEKAKSRIDERLHREQSGWYEAQKVRDVSALEVTLDTEHLALLCEQIAIEGGQFKMIEAEVSKRSQQVVEGKIANMIGAELVRRLHPELTVANVGAALRARTLDNEMRRLPAYHVYNEYRTVFDDSQSMQLSQSERQKKVEGVSTSDTGTMVAREFSWEGGQRLKSLIALLKNPSYFTYVLGNEMRGRTNDAAAQATREQIARALIQGVTFLQAICEDEDVRHIAERELGLVGYLDPGEEGVLGKAQAELRRTFADQKDAEPDETKNSGLTLYDTALAEGQLESDAGVVKLITQTRSREIKTLSEQKTTEVKTIIKTSLATVTQELQDIAKAKEHRDQLLSRQTEVAEAKTELIREKEKVEAQQVADTWVERKFHKGSPTTAEKAATLAHIAISIQTRDQDIASLQGDIDKLAVVTDEQIALAQKRAEGIARLAKQAHAVE